MSLYYDSEKDRFIHNNAILSIASHYHLDETVIKTLYEFELENLMVNARIKQYLPVLTIHLVKDYLHQTHIVETHQFDI